MATHNWVSHLGLPFVLLLVFSVLADLPLRAEPAAQEEALPAPDWIGIYDLRGKVGLRWIKNPSFTAVRIYRRRDAPGEVFELQATIRNNSFIDTQVVSRQTYVYRLVAVGPGGETGPPSSEKSIPVMFAERRPLTPPSWEGYLSLEEGIGLRWSDLPDLEVMAFNVYRRMPEEPDFRLVASTKTTSYYDRDVKPQQTYIYALTTLDSTFKESSFSGELSMRYLPPRMEAEAGPEAARATRRTRLVKILTSGDGDFLRPADVALNPNSGDVYLTDSGTNTVQVFDGQFRFLRSLGGQAAGVGHFRNLLGIEVVSDEEVYFVDAGENAVYVFGTGGAFHRRVEMTKYFALHKLGLIDVVAGSDGRVFVIDNLNSRVCILRGEELVRSFGSTGYGGGELSAPTFGGTDARGFLYLSDTLNGRIQVFDPGGNFVRAFGGHSQGWGGMGRPKGVAVNSRGEIFVADSWLNVIQVFDSEGRFLAMLTDEKDRLLDLGSPNGIALDDRNRIYIAERLSHRLQIREILDEE